VPGEGGLSWLALGGARGSAQAGEPTRLTLALSPAISRRVRLARRTGTAVEAKVAVTGRDPAGESVARRIRFEVGG
jgi:hypothetical protein